MITNSTPITTAGLFDQLFISNVILIPTKYLIANAFPSNGTHTLRVPIKTLSKRSQDIVNIENAIVAEARRHANLSTGDVIKRIIISTGDIDAAISIRVDSVNSANVALPVWKTNDARTLMITDSVFATVFSTNMAALGALF